MFGKLKAAFSKFKKDVTDEPAEKEVVKQEAKISLKDKIVSKFKKAETEDKKEEFKVEKKGFFARRSEEKVDNALEDFEEELIQNNVAYEITERILDEIKTELIENKKKASSDIIKDKLTEILNDVLQNQSRLIC